MQIMGRMLSKVTAPFLRNARLIDFVCNVEPEVFNKLHILAPNLEGVLFNDTIEYDCDTYCTENL
jgi:hypothetical protein